MRSTRHSSRKEEMKKGFSFVGDFLAPPHKSQSDRFVAHRSERELATIMFATLFT